jgi:hypothetical protein
MSSALSTRIIGAFLYLHQGPQPRRREMGTRINEVTQLNIVEVCVVMASAVRRADGTSELSLTFYMWSTAPCTSRSTMSGSRAAGRSSASPPRLRLPFPPRLRIDRALAGRGQELGHEFSESSTTSRSTLLPEIFLALREEDDHEAMDLH